MWLTLDELKSDCKRDRGEENYAYTGLEPIELLHWYIERCEELIDEIKGREERISELEAALSEAESIIEDNC